MRITYDHQAFSRLPYGGAPRYFTELISRVARASQASVSLFMGLHVNRYGLEKHAAQCERFFGMRLPERGGRRWRPWLNRFLFERYLAPDVSGIYHPTHVESLVPGSKARLVVTIYDMLHELFPSYYPNSSQVAARKREIVAAADGIICISESTRDDLVAICGVSPEKIRVIHLGNSLAATGTADRLVAQPYLLHVGQRAHTKNFRLLLDTYAQASEINQHYQLVCFGGLPFTGEELAVIRQYRLEHRVVRVQGSDSRLANLYRHAAAYVCPSLYEGFGIPLLEAMHGGCPVVAARAGSIPEVLGDAGLYFDPRSRADLLAQLLLVLRGDDLRRSMISKGLARERLFSWDRCAQETLAFYEFILGR